MKQSAQLNVEPRSLKFAAEACGGEIRGGSPTTAFTRVCTDTRAVQPGDLFIALQGERFDAHDFLPDAAIRGAAALVLGFPRAAACPAGVPAVVVEDTRAALGRIAARYRRDFDIPVIAVAGSNGKTTTKEILGTVFERKFPTLRSEASFNNDIGVPLTLLKLDASHRAAVLEVGSNHPGELAPLLDLIQPRFGVLTSIGREHLEFFGDLDGVAREEGALAEALPADGKLFVNGDTPKLDAILPRARAAVVRVGCSAGNDWCVRDITLTAEGTRFTLNGPFDAVSGAYRIGLLGRHQAVNAALVVAVAAELGLSRAEIAAGLAEAKPAKMRLQVVAARGFQILDDSYNANADSMIAALETLRDLPCTARRVAVLGVMAELGKQSESAHAEIGRATVRCGVGRLFALGAHAETMAVAARAAGLAEVEVFADADAALPAIRAAVQPGDVVLVKASRSARLERVVAGLSAAEPPRP